MKTIEQLLELSKNPYYIFTNDEKAVLDDFLDKKQDSASEKSAKKGSKKSDSSTPVIATEDNDKNHGAHTVKIRNVVEKTIPSVEESGQ